MVEFNQIYKILRFDLIIKEVTFLYRIVIQTRPAISVNLDLVCFWFWHKIFRLEVTRPR